ncbi:MAG TPA: ROK family protein [Spirochaetia bacterium]|nr:ROK family protein [Spirochaetia bacterium]
MSANNHESAVMAAIFELDEPTRSAIAERSGLSLVSVTGGLDALKRKRLVREAGKSVPATGRPSVVYELSEAAGVTLGVSFDLESIGSVLVDASKGTVATPRISAVTSPLAADNPQEVLGLIEEVCRHSIEELPRSRIHGIGVALAGLVNGEAGTWVSGLRIRGIDHLPVRSYLEERLGLPVFVDDIARTITTYERTLGAARGISDLVVLHIGMGVGSGIVINNRLYSGHHGVAGEIGHLVVDSEGYRCLCGNVGCLETVLSVPGIVRRIEDRMGEVGLPTHLADPYVEDATPNRREKEPNGYQLIERILGMANSGDRLTRTALFEIGAFLGDAVVKVVSLYDPRALVITGLGARLGPYLEVSMRQTMMRHTVSAVRPELEVAFADYQPHHEAAGAALLAMERILQRRGRFDLTE